MRSNYNNKNKKNEDIKERTSSEFLSLYNQLKAINLSVANDTPTIISVLAARVSIIGCRCSYKMIHSTPQQFCLSCKVLTPINNELLESFSDLVEYSAAIEKQYQDKDA
jgi:hypothetical protein